MSNSDGWYDHLTGPIHNASATGNVAGQDDTDTNANDSLIPVLPLSMSANPGDIPTTPWRLWDSRLGQRRILSITP